MMKKTTMGALAAVLCLTATSMAFALPPNAAREQDAASRKLQERMEQMRRFQAEEARRRAQEAAAERDRWQMHPDGFERRGKRCTQRYYLKPDGTTGVRIECSR